MLPKNMSSDLIQGWTHTRIKFGCKLRKDSMPNFLESITFMRFD